MDARRTLALINGTVYPFAAPGKASGVFARDGVVEVVGDDRDVLERCDARTVVLDLRGRFAFPGRPYPKHGAGAPRPRQEFLLRCVHGGQIWP